MKETATLAATVTADVAANEAADMVATETADVAGSGRHGDSESGC